MVSAGAYQAGALRLLAEVVQQRGHVAKALRRIRLPVGGDIARQ